MNASCNWVDLFRSVQFMWCEQALKSSLSSQDELTVDRRVCVRVCVQTSRDEHLLLAVLALLLLDLVFLLPWQLVDPVTCTAWRITLIPTGAVSTIPIRLLLISARLFKVEITRKQINLHYRQVSPSQQWNKAVIDTKTLPSRLFAWNPFTDSFKAAFSLRILRCAAPGGAQRVARSVLRRFSPQQAATLIVHVANRAYGVKMR